MPDDVALFTDDDFVELSVRADIMLEVNGLSLLIDIRPSRRRIRLQCHIVGMVGDVESLKFRMKLVSGNNVLLFVKFLQ